MKDSRRWERRHGKAFVRSALGLTILDGLLGGTAVLGGVALLFGWLGIPLELLADSPFMSYTVPALTLIVLVGGSGVLAAVLLIWRSAAALAVSGVAGLIIVAFEMVELGVIGFSWLLALYVVLGLAILALTLGLWLVGRITPTGVIGGAAAIGPA